MKAHKRLLQSLRDIENNVNAHEWHRKPSQFKKRNNRVTFKQGNGK